MNAKLSGLLIFLVLISAPFAAACSDDDDGNSDAGSTGASAATGAVQPTNDEDANNGGAAISLDGALPDLVAAVSPSVVAVVTETGEGSGVIWSSDGNIVTNNHVVQNASSVEIVLASGERLPADVVATDPLTDLAVLHVDHTDLHAATFSDQLPRVGSLALAIGNPLGFESSVSLGIVSGLNRAIPSGGQTPALVDLLQTDAAISPGNSGGALVNLSGEVIGINVAYIPPAASAVSLGFAIPAPTAVNVVEQLLDGGTVEHAFLGISPRPLTPNIAAQLGLSVSEGVLVFGLTSQGAAEEAGVEPGDVIVQLDDDDIGSIEDLYASLREASPGETVPITVVREGGEETLEVTLQDRPGP